jgi:hypothetical protein
VLLESATQTADVAIVSAIDLTGDTTAAVTFYPTAASAAGKCAGGKRGTSENKGNRKDNHGLTQHGDLF